MCVCFDVGMLVTTRDADFSGAAGDQLVSNDGMFVAGREIE